MEKDKVLKLTNAVYKVLEFFPESDPLKNRAKDRALTIMDHLILINGTGGWVSFHDAASVRKTRVQVLEEIDVLLGYLWIGKTQGWLSAVNCLIISNEYERITKEISPSEELVAELAKKIPEMPELYVAPVLQKEETIAPQTTPKSVLKSTGTQKEGVPVLLASEIPSRQKMILDFLDKNKKAQVMDLQAVFPNITKRTIRRDLDELMGAGKIVRMGDFNQIFYQLA